MKSKKGFWAITDKEGQRRTCWDIFDYVITCLQKDINQDLSKIVAKIENIDDSVGSDDDDEMMITVHLDW